MFLGKTKLMLSFALIGFLVGSAIYFLFNWIIINSAAGTLYIPVPIFAPWLMAGIAGSFLSVIILSVAAHFSK